MRLAQILAILLFSPLTALAQLIPNGRFDSDISGWVLPSQPQTVVTWDAFGSPSGSMRIESSWSPPGSAGIVATTASCLDLPAGSYTLMADFFESAPNNNDGCFLEVMRYSSLGCATGSPSGTSVGWSVSGSWQHLELRFHVLEPVTNSWRVSLAMSKYPGEEPSRCYFDNVRLLGPPVQTVEVPTLNGTALFAYASVLAAAALMALRRRVSVGR